MRRYFRNVVTWVLGAASLAYALIPEGFYTLLPLGLLSNYDAKVLLGRLLAFVVIAIVIAIVHALYLRFRKKVTIRLDGCEIVVKYGDLFDENECRRLVNFDECFITSVGQAPGDIRPDSVCGQYLAKSPDLNIQKLIEQSGIVPEETPSEFEGKTRYPLGSVIENGDDILFAFAKLSKYGRAEFSSREEYLECLSKLWFEIYNRHGGKNVCIPILGSGAAEFVGGFGKTATQQECLDMMLRSYSLCTHKVKSPNRLCIVCRPQEGFSINKIGLV